LRRRRGHGVGEVDDLDVDWRRLRLRDVHRLRVGVSSFMRAKPPATPQQPTAAAARTPEDVQ